MNFKQILISQPSPTTEKNPFSELSSKFNVQFTFHPLTTIERVDIKEFRSQRIDILDHTAIILTSKTAINNLFSIAEDARVTIPEAMKYFCVNETIALYLQKYIVYRKRKIFFGKGTFIDLIDILVKHKDLKYLFPLNDQYKSEQLTHLTKAGITHNKVILSHTVASPLDGINLEDYQMAVIYSPAEAKTLIGNPAFITSDLKIASFGANTTNELFKANIKSDLFAPQPLMPSMVTALDKYLNAAKSGSDLSSFVAQP